MHNLLRFFLKHHFTILFVLIETFSIFLLINNNNYQNSKFVRFTRSLSGGFHEKVIQIENYLSLREKNEKLVQENVELRNYIAKYIGGQRDTLKTQRDTLHEQQFKYIDVQVINNSVNKQQNYITINKGLADGIEPEVGVISREGIVGIVKGVSEHFSTVISLLNTELKISAKHKGSGYFGSLNWVGGDYQYAYLNEIPLHTQIERGDTVVTSGYSSIFPVGVLIGFVENWEDQGGNFNQVKVRLSIDFKNISEVYVIKNIYKEEQRKLEEESTPND